jgi:uncharacterized protein (DUF427 family)
MHSVEVEPAPGPVTVKVRGRLVARSVEALLLTETLHRDRFYIPRRDVVATVDGPTGKRTHCPYKGDASYWSVAGTENVAWSYEHPVEGMGPIAGHLSFDGVDVEIEND